MCSDFYFFWWIQQCWKTQLQKGWKCKVVSWWTIKSICQKDWLSIMTNIRLLIVGFTTLTRDSVIPVYSARSHDDWGCTGRPNNTRQREHLSLNRICMSLEETTIPLTNKGQWPCAKSFAHHKRGRGLIHSGCPWWYTEHGWMHFSDHCLLKYIFIFSHSDWGRNDPVINSSWVTFDGSQGNRSHIHVWLAQKLNRVHGEKKKGLKGIPPAHY